MHFVRIVSEYGSKLNKYQYILDRELSYEMTWLLRLYYPIIAGLEEERGEKKKVEEGSPPS